MDLKVPTGKRHYSQVMGAGPKAHSVFRSGGLGEESDRVEAERRKLMRFWDWPWRSAGRCRVPVGLQLVPGQRLGPGLLGFPRAAAHLQQDLLRVHCQGNEVHFESLLEEFLESRGCSEWSLLSPAPGL